MKKSMIIQYTSAVVLLAFLLSSCKKYDEFQNNPNQASAATPALLLTGVSYSVFYEDNTSAAYATRHLTYYERGNSNVDYSWRAGSFGNYDILRQVMRMDSLASLTGQAQYRGMTKFFRALLFAQLTEDFGDIPYSRALEGLEGNFTPEYDTQESIYNALFQLLDEANTSITSGNIPGDIMYNGDMTKWKKLGNTIHLLMALRLSEVDATKASSEFNKALAKGIMTSNADNFVYKHLAEENNQNYWYGQVVAQNREWWALTETLVDYMNPLNDPRLAVFGKKNTSGVYKGLQLGTTVGIPNTTGVSLLGTTIYDQNAPVYLVTYAQALFALAEAAKRGWITGGDAVAETNYKLGIEQSFRQWTGGTTGLAAYLAEPEVAYDPARAIEQISIQRYIHLFMHGYEAWAEWRRTGFPDNLITPAGNQIPTRLGYPDNEEFNNTENFRAAIQRQFGGTNNQYGKVWWDK